MGGGYYIPKYLLGANTAVGGTSYTYCYNGDNKIINGGKIM